MDVARACCAAAAKAVCRRLRQRLAVDLAAVGQRHLLEHRVRCRHHVLGQLSARKGTQLLVHRLCRHGSCVGPWLPELHIRSQEASRPSNKRHRARLDTLVLKQHVLDLTELNAQAAKLHLLVDASHVADGAVGEPATEIAGAVHASVRRVWRSLEGAVDEDLGCLVWESFVSSADLVS